VPDAPDRPAPANPSGTCYGCADTFRGALGQRREHRVSSDEPTFMDSRTGRWFCSNCIVALVTWELDDRPEDDQPDNPYPEWLGERGPGDV
jgi:hypothetical protein